jgi:hypothetical protein
MGAIAEFAGNPRQDLRAVLRGAVLAAEDPGHEAARHLDHNVVPAA